MSNEAYEIVILVVYTVLGSSLLWLFVMAILDEIKSSRKRRLKCS